MFSFLNAIVQIYKCDIFRTLGLFKHNWKCYDFDLALQIIKENCGNLDEMMIKNFRMVAGHISQNLLWMFLSRIKYLIFGHTIPFTPSWLQPKQSLPHTLDSVGLVFTNILSFYSPCSVFFKLLKLTSQNLSPKKVQTPNLKGNREFKA